MKKYTVISFYKFVEMNHLISLKASLKVQCSNLNLLGTIILAEEGINATLSGSTQDIHDFVTKLHLIAPFLHLTSDDLKYSTTNTLPFKKLKVYIKKEIVTLGMPYINPTKITGTQIDATDWNKLIADPEVLVIDTRNDFEVKLGSFTRAVNPETKQFRDFPEYVTKTLDPKQHKKIAMFCTGGIRCEKASSYLLEQGFENVYQLKGGILKYLEQVDEKESTWQGQCFIFDNRETFDVESIQKLS